MIAAFLLFNSSPVPVTCQYADSTGAHSVTIYPGAEVRVEAQLRQIACAVPIGFPDAIRIRPAPAKRDAR